MTLGQSGSDNNRTDSPFSTERTVCSVIITAIQVKSVQDFCLFGPQRAEIRNF